MKIKVILKTICLIVFVLTLFTISGSTIVVSRNSGYDYGIDGNNWVYFWLQRINPQHKYVRDWEGNLIPITPELLLNNSKLLEVGRRINLDDLVAKGIPITGVYSDVPTATFYVGLTDIKEEYTEIIKAIIGEVEGVKVEFFKARFTLAELYGFQRKIEKTGLRNLRQLGVPITLLGVDVRTNSLFIGLEELKPEYIEVIRKIIENREVPIRFEIFKGMVPLSDRNSRHRPLIGGIRIDTSHLWWQPRPSTLGFQATRRDGRRGFVMTGHSGGVNTTVYQPSFDWVNSVGTITHNTSGDRQSDSAFVTLNAITTIHPLIWLGSPIMGWEAANPNHIGTYAWKEGIATGTTLGLIHNVGVPVWDHINQRFLLNQVTAAYHAQTGDSGGPVYHPYGAPVVILGVVVGQAVGGLNFYSPVCGIARDLDLNWGSTW